MKLLFRLSVAPSNAITPYPTLGLPNASKPLLLIVLALTVAVARGPRTAIPRFLLFEIVLFVTDIFCSVEEAVEKSEKFMAAASAVNLSVPLMFTPVIFKFNVAADELPAVNE